MRTRLTVALICLAALTPFASDAADGSAQPALTDPVWKSHPSAAHLADFYPERALRMGIGGDAVARCIVAASGHLGDCELVSQQPDDQAFGSVLLKLVPIVKVEPTTASGAPTVGRPIYVQAKFSVPPTRSRSGLRQGQVDLTLTPPGPMVAGQK